MGASAGWDSQDLTEAIIAWLDALAAWLQWPLPCTHGAISALVGAGKMLEQGGRSTTANDVPKGLTRICCSAAATGATSPLSQLAAMSLSTRTVALVSRFMLLELKNSIDAALDAKLSLAVQQGSWVAWKERRRLWQTARTTLHHLGGLSQTLEEQRALIMAGLDLILVHALLRCPSTRSLWDQDELMSDCTAHALELLVSRLEWPGAARLLQSMGQASSLDVGNSAVLALFRCLYRGNAKEPRCECLVALLVLVVLLQYHKRWYHCPTPYR
jgi:hypothetical protein